MTIATDHDSAERWVVCAELMRALVHPLRLPILRRAARRRVSPKELADEFDAPLGNVSYHVRELHAAGFLRRVGTVPRRGSIEHFYRVDGIRLTRALGALCTEARELLEEIGPE